MALLALLLLCCSGCIFIRLSRILIQMKDPEKHLEVDMKMVPFTAKLLNPVVLLGDLEILLNHKAIKKESFWRFEFEKSGPQDREPWGINVWLDDANRIQQFSMPPRLSEVMGNEFIMRAIEAIGRAEISIHNKRIYLSLNYHVERAQVLELMGEPISESPHELAYRFGDKEDAFVVTMQGEALLNKVIMEANHYGCEVEILSP